ncbi:hypothetical protein BHE74_00005618 [Ensete ventricosum]|nr:hypothetical protein GW17_00051768 [Ensete ventricosum]RWW85681.1 hypothetical protein BHE74_00005618 [Ensete ventricosum]
MLTLQCHRGDVGCSKGAAAIGGRWGSDVHGYYYSERSLLVAFCRKVRCWLRSRRMAARGHCWQCWVAKDVYAVEGIREIGQLKD